MSGQQMARAGGGAYVWDDQILLDVHELLHSCRPANTQLSVTDGRETVSLCQVVLLMGQ